MIQSARSPHCQEVLAGVKNARDCEASEISSSQHSMALIMGQDIFFLQFFFKKEGQIPQIYTPEMLDCWELVCQALLSDHNGLQKRNGGFIKPSPFEFLSFFLSFSTSVHHI